MKTDRIQVRGISRYPTADRRSHTYRVREQIIAYEEFRPNTWNSLQIRYLFSDSSYDVWFLDVEGGRFTLRDMNGQPYINRQPFVISPLWTRHRFQVPFYGSGSEPYFVGNFIFDYRHPDAHDADELVLNRVTRILAMPNIPDDVRAELADLRREIVFSHLNAPIPRE